MTQEISELMDSELEGAQAERAIRRCCGEEGGREEWLAYHAIGEVMRGGAPARAGSTRRILEAIQAEPTVLAPRRVRYAAAGRMALAAAASVATVAVVAWIGLQQQPAAGPSLAAKSTPPVSAVLAVSESVPGVQDYVVVHRQVPAADFYRAVSLTESAPR